MSWQKKKINGILLYNTLLGEGQFGKVFLGQSEKDKNQFYAVKQLSLKNCQIDHIQREINILQSLGNTPNIVNLYKTIRTGSNLYLVMELCLDGNLRQCLDKRPNKRLSEQEAVVFLGHIVEGFKELSNKNIIHRDIKPANIMLKDGQAKLADFGLSRIIDDDSGDYFSRVGSPLYMAPQLLKGDKFNSKCDVWSVGVVLFEMLYGKTPWEGDNQFQLNNSIHTQPLSFPEFPKNSKAIKELISSMLKCNQDSRISWKGVFKHKVLCNKLYFEQENIEDIELLTSDDSPLFLNNVMVKSVSSNAFYVQQNKNCIYLKKIINNADECDIPDERIPTFSLKSSVLQASQQIEDLSDFINMQSNGQFQKLQADMIQINLFLIVERNLNFFLCYCNMQIDWVQQKLIEKIGVENFFTLKFLMIKLATINHLALLKKIKNKSSLENFDAKTWQEFQIKQEHFFLIQTVKRDIEVIDEIFKDVKLVSNNYIKNENLIFYDDNLSENPEFVKYYVKFVNQVVQVLIEDIDGLSVQILRVLWCIQLTKDLKQAFQYIKKLYEFDSFYEELENSNAEMIKIMILSNNY